MGVRKSYAGPVSPDAPVAAAHVASTMAPLELAHYRLGHISDSGLTRLVSENSHGLSYSAKDCALPFCEVCALTKSKTAPMSTIPVPVPPIPFTRIGMDIWGPMIKSVTGQGVWEFVDLPSGANLIGTRWVFKLKLDSLGNVARYKARLVARASTKGRVLITTKFMLRW